MTKRIESIRCPVCGKPMQIRRSHVRGGVWVICERSQAWRGYRTGHVFESGGQGKSRAAAVRALLQSVRDYSEQVDAALERVKDEACVCCVYQLGVDCYVGDGCIGWEQTPILPRVLYLLESEEEIDV